MKKTKPIYGRSQGTHLKGVSKESTTKVKYAKSCEANNRARYNKTKSKKVALKSLPRTIVQIGIVIAIGYWISKNTSLGQNITQSITVRLSTVANDANKMQQRVDPTNLSQQRQQKFDERFNDAWKKACGKDKDC